MLREIVFALDIQRIDYVRLVRAGGRAKKEYAEAGHDLDDFFYVTSLC